MTAPAESRGSVPTTRAQRERVLVIGASSGIGRAVAAALAADGSDLVLAGRRTQELSRDAKDLSLRHGVRADACAFEALDFESHARLLESVVGDGAFDGLVLCHGDMAEQELAQADFERTRQMIDVNYTSAVSILERAAAHFEANGEAKGAGWICALSSVAGDRGRGSNYLYGSTKAALSTYLEGLEARLAAVGVATVTVKPGFVDTSMTYGMGLPLVAAPERVARDVVRGIRRRRSVVYTPWFWRFVMLGLRLLPRPIFRRLPI